MFFIFIFFIIFIDGYKILLINPRFAHSHIMSRGKFADILAAAGHEIVVYQPIFDAKINKTGSSHPTIRYIFTDHKAEEIDRDNQDIFWEDDTIFMIMKISSLSDTFKNSHVIFQMANDFFEVHKNHCSIILKDTQILEDLKNENFDLGFGELFDACSFGIFELIGLKKYIALHSGGMIPGIQGYLGISKSLSFGPSVFSTYTDQMNFFQRLGNFFVIQLEEWVTDKMCTNGPEVAIKKVIPDFDMQRKIKESVFLFVNSDEHVDFTMAMTSKLIFTGGLGKTHSKPLPKKYLGIFDSAKKGVIYFSFGSIVKSQNMSENMIKTFLESFSEFPEINFIWKFENDTHKVAKDYPNVFTFKWLPQNDILDHPKTLAFITHGGMNSVIESATKGVPMICISFFGDQNHNAMILERRGISETILKKHVTKKVLVETIKKIINDKKYKENAKLLSKMVKSKIMKAEERIVKYSEFAAEFGDSGTLQSKGRNLNWIQLYSIDIFTFLIVSILLTVFGVVKLIQTIIKKLKTLVFVVSNNKKCD